ncbi:MAG: hypothetical protein Q9191_004983, partial [Dirinaria sp. TL-2023a]
MSQSRQKLEAEEARRIHEEKQRDLMEPLAENEQVHWDGLRRRKTVVSLPVHAASRRRTLHPPLGMSSFPVDEPDERTGSGEDERGGAIDAGFASTNPRVRIAQSAVFPSSRPRSLVHVASEAQQSPMHPVPLTEISLAPSVSSSSRRSTESPTATTAYFPHRPQQASPSVFGLPTGISRRAEDYDGASDAAQGHSITWADS